jgi:hypothetical protein
MRSLRGFNNEKRVVDWLNRESGDKATRERMTQLVRDVRALAGAEPMLFPYLPPEKADLIRTLGLDDVDWLEAMQRLAELGHLKIGAGNRQFNLESKARLDSVLASFQYRPYCNLARSDGAGTGKARAMTGKLILHMIPSGWNPPEPTAGDARRGVWPTSQVIDKAPTNVQEAFMVQFLVAIAGSGNIDRIRECPCGKWILAVPSTKRHCDEVCKKKFAVRTEDQKQHKRERRNEYMKAYWKMNPSKRSNRKASTDATMPAKKGGN